MIQNTKNCVYEYTNRNVRFYSTLVNIGPKQLPNSLSCTLRRECVRTLWMRAPYWGRGGRAPIVVTRSVS
jgi:hypothetical protein